MEGVFVSDHPLVKHKLTMLRDEKTDSTLFRQLVRELAILLGYEATRDLALSPRKVRTPMGDAQGHEITESIGLVPVLRAGLGMVNGIWEMIPGAEVWHIGLFRDEKTLKPVQYYNKLPVDPRVQVCLILDPMLATGGSASATASLLKEWGAILASALLFGLIHLDRVTGDAYTFYRVPFAFAVALGLGVLRVRSGSLVPGLVAHALLNTITFSAVLLGLDTEAPADANVLQGAGLLLGGLAASLLLLRRFPRRPDAS